MTKRLLTLLIATAVSAIFFSNIVTSVTADEEPIDPLLPVNTTLFYWDTCPHCTVVKNHIIEYSIDQKITLDQFETHDPAYTSMFSYVVGICDSGGAVPLLYHQGECFVGSYTVIDKLDELAGIVYPEPEPIPVYTPPPAPVIEYAPISEIKIAEKFNGGDNSTFDKLELDDAKSFNGLVLHVEDTVKIEYKGEIDLSSQDIADKFEKLDENLVIRKGYVMLDSENLSQLDKPAKITFYGVRLVDESKFYISKDREINEELTEAAIYDVDKETLTIEVDSFSEYSIESYFELKSGDESDERMYLFEAFVGDLDARVNVFYDEDVEMYTNLVGDYLEPDENGYVSVEISLFNGVTNFNIEIISSAGLSTWEDFSVKYNQQTVVENEEDTVILYGNIALIAFGFGLFFIVIGVVVFFIVKKVKGKRKSEPTSKSSEKKTEKKKKINKDDSKK